MNVRSKTILIVTTLIISMLLSVFPAQPAMARDGRGGGRSASRSRPARSRFGRSDRGRTRTSRSHGGFGRSRGGRGFGGSSIGLSFGFSDSYYSTSYQQWAPGYYQTRTEQVLVEPGHYEWQTQQVQVEPGRYEIRQIPAVEQTRHDDQGKAYKVVISPARTETVWIPPKYQERKIKVWVPDRYETRQFRTWVPGRWVNSPAYAPGPSSFFRIGGTFRF